MKEPRVEFEETVSAEFEKTESAVPPGITAVPPGDRVPKVRYVDRNPRVHAWTDNHSVIHSTMV